MIGFFETPLDLAHRQVAEAELRHARQVDLVAGFAGSPEVLLHAQQLLTEIARTLAVARTHHALLLSFCEDG